MKFLARMALAIIVNAAVLFAAAYFLPGFVLELDFKVVFALATALTALNFFLRPVLKLIFGPIIVLTLGLGLLLLNVLILKILDFLSIELTIQTIPALVYSTLIFSIANFIFHVATKHRD